MIKLSIIIPIYNSEKYLSNCIKSTLNQDLSKSEYEIILINDGSTDGSENIILPFEEANDNIIYLKQNNKGVSSARNWGLTIAKGNYVTFIDSDDSINENTLGSIVAAAIKENLDILYLNLTYCDSNGIFIEDSPKVGSDELVHNGFVHERRTFISTLYKKELIKNIYFVPGIIVGEDTVFNAMAQSKALRCSYFSLPYYNYFQHANSASNKTKSEKVFNGCLIAIKKLEEFKIQNFPNPKAIEEEYFNKVKLIFLQRLLDWNIVPTLNKKRFTKVKLFLKENNLTYLEDLISKQYKFFNKPFVLFFIFHFLVKKYLYLKLIFDKAKRKISKSK